MLREDAFLSIVEQTPLVSIDLVIRNQAGQVLMGQRTNAPAKGYWFVPGGRIRKDEPVESAFERICLNELGTRMDYSATRFLGIYDHFYDSNFAEAPGISTHYVALAHEVNADLDLDALPTDQHRKFEWIQMDDPRADIHDHSRAYLEAVAPDSPA